MIKNSKCLLCSRKANNKFFNLSTYMFCKNCMLAWKKNFPKGKYDETYYKGKSSIAQKIFSPVANLFYSIRNSYVHKKVNSWIDIGAGEGGFLKTVNAKKRIGVEVSSSGRKMMEDDGISTLSDKEFLRTDNLNADVISFWHVLEHVENPLDYLVAAKKNLARNGKIIIGIPNFNSLEFMFVKQYWFHLQPKFHLWHFSPTSIKKLLNKSGFTIEKIDYWSIEHHLTGVLQSFINKCSKSDENVLHKLIKRGTDKKKIKGRDIFWSLFFLTVGLPFVVLFWTIGWVMKKSGTIVVVASTSKIF